MPPSPSASRVPASVSVSVSVWLVAAFVLPVLLLGGGWYWARTALSGYQARLGSVDVQASPLAAEIHRQALEIPLNITLVGMAVVLLVAGVVLWLRRRRALFAGLCFYAVVLFFVSLLAFVGFEFEAFD